MNDGGNIVGRAEGSALLERGAQVEAYVQAQTVERRVRERLSSVDKGIVLKVLLAALPILTALVSVLGGLFTVYASTDCKGTDFAAYSRAFLYTSIAYAVVNPVVDKGIGFFIHRLLGHPTIAFCVYCGQALVLTGFFVALTVLLGLVWNTACPSVTQKVRDRLR